METRSIKEHGSRVLIYFDMPISSFEDGGYVDDFEQSTVLPLLITADIYQKKDREGKS